VLALVLDAELDESRVLTSVSQLRRSLAPY
jgi:hypothetical protein